MESKKAEKNVSVNGNMDGNIVIGDNNIAIHISSAIPESETEHARRLIVFLEDRRVLYQRNQLTPLWANQSVIKIREQLTSELAKLDKKSDLAKSLAEMKKACHKYLDTTEALGLGRDESRVNELSREEQDNFLVTLNELRDVFGSRVAQISIQFGINVEGELATIFPTKTL